MATRVAFGPPSVGVIPCHTHRLEETVTEPHTHDTDREVIVTERSGGTGMIFGVILAILALAFVVWLFLGMDGDGGSADVIPDDVNVNVTVDDGG